MAAVVTRAREVWTPLASLAELERRGGRMVVRRGRHRIALFATPDGLRACANRCPHEGYPLVAGSLSRADGRCVLTCNWHNWKFDLDDDGANLMQGEGVRVYRLRVRDGGVEADLAEPDPARRRVSVMAGLRGAVDQHDYARIAREQARWQRAGGDPLEPLRDAIRRSHDRLQWGWTHAYAATADWLALRETHADDAEAGLACLAESLAHIGWDVLRQPRFAYTRRRRRFDEQRFVDAVEAEDEDTAVALVRGAVAAGDGFARLEPALARAALAHYNDFGHSLIYVTKTAALVRRLGETVTLPLLLPLVRGLVYATREDLVPDFRDYAPALAALRGATGRRLPAMKALRSGGVKATLRAVVAAGAVPPARLHRRLLAAAADAMLAFDLSHERRATGAVTDNVGWLDFTHAITFAAAVREQCTRLPALWPEGLLQMACFVGRNNGFTLARTPLARWRVSDEKAFDDTVDSLLLDHGRDDYIASAHLLKTSLAARGEAAALPPGRDRALLLAAVNRLLHEPMKRRHVRRTAHQALRFAALEG